MWPVHKYLYYIYVYVCMYVCMYVCICICIHVNVCHIYIVDNSMSCIYSYMCIPSQIRSRHHLTRCQRRWWECQRLKSLFENVGVFEVHELHDFFVHSEHETEESVKTEGSLGEKSFFGKKIVNSNRRELTYTPPERSLWEGEGNGTQRFP